MQNEQSGQPDLQPKTIINPANSRKDEPVIPSTNEYAEDQKTKPITKPVEIRTTMDSNSNRKTMVDSQGRTNFNTSMQNLPRGLINTAFSLNSNSTAGQDIPSLPLPPQKILKFYMQELTDYEKAEVLDFQMIYFLGKSKANKVD